MSTVAHVVTPDMVADDVIARSLEFESVRDMLIAAATAAIPSPSTGTGDTPTDSSAEQLIRAGVRVSPDAPISEVRDQLVRAALDADGWQCADRAYRAAVDVVLRAIGLPV